MSSATASSPVAPEGTSAVPATHRASDVVVVKSEHDPNEYRHYTLANGLAVLLVKTPYGAANAADNDSAPVAAEADAATEAAITTPPLPAASPATVSAPAGGAVSKPAAVAISVRTGFFKDPAAFPGLAHFLEHMLFMGSGKYPGENQWEEFISAHGGYSNASTDAEHTVYQFEIHPRKLVPALDMFAHFFISPRFAPDAVGREVRAVHSEFKETLQSDFARGLDVVSETCVSGHPLSIFGWGNIDSLEKEPARRGLVTRDALVKFHGENYSAAHMTLVRFRILCVFYYQSI